MAYSVYFKYGNKSYKLPVNPEEIRRTRTLNVEKYQVVGGRQVSVPTHCELEEYSFEAEFPSQAYHYVENVENFHDADYFEKMFQKAQRERKPIRFIASNGITDDISTKVLVLSVESVEKAGEEGDKYLSLNLLEYVAASKRYVAVQTQTGAMVKQEDNTPDIEQENPAVGEGTTYTVMEGDTLWAIARKYYGNGERYPKIASANPAIRNPNLIYPGQVLTIPA